MSNRREVTGIAFDETWARSCTCCLARNTTGRLFCQTRMITVTQLTCELARNRRNLFVQQATFLLRESQFPLLNLHTATCMQIFQNFFIARNTPRRRVFDLNKREILSRAFLSPPSRTYKIPGDGSRLVKVTRARMHLFRS